MKKNFITLLFLSIIFLLFAFSDVFADEYVAFSLKVAKERIISVQTGQDYRKLHPEVFYLGGITAVRGLVHDRKTGDIILVGERDVDRADLSLDDFVVALRARFIHGKWPLVSIDPPENVKKNKRLLECVNMNIVRYEGGIEDTQFGEDLFDADYRLKKIDMGLLPSGVVGHATSWELGMEKAKHNINLGTIPSRFWFSPVLPYITVRKDVVAIKGLKVKVFTETFPAEIDGKKVEYISAFQDIADKVARSVNDNFEKLSKVHLSFSRLQGLNELVALTRAIEVMDTRPDLNWWLKEYTIKKVRTKKEVKQLKRYTAISGGRYSIFGLYGGVELTATALRLNVGDVTALKDAVLKTRPKTDSLSWSFIVGVWLIPTSPGMMKVGDIAPLFAQALFLKKQKFYDDAITLYGRIIELKPDWSDAYSNRGNVYVDKGNYDRAISDFNKALEINPGLAETYYNRGTTYYGKGDYDRAISDFNKALEINPTLADAYSNRGTAYYEKGNYDRAISDFNKALEINPGLTETYYNRGTTYYGKGDYDRAISDFNKALEINPTLAKVYFNKAIACEKTGRFSEAIKAYNGFMHYTRLQYAPYIERVKKRIRDLERQ